MGLQVLERRILNFNQKVYFNVNVGSLKGPDAKQNNRPRSGGMCLLCTPIPATRLAHDSCVIYNGSEIHHADLNLKTKATQLLSSLLRQPISLYGNMRIENTNEGTCEVECTDDSTSPRNYTARVALSALFAVLSVSIVF